MDKKHRINLWIKSRFLLGQDILRIDEKLKRKEKQHFNLMQAIYKEKERLEKAFWLGGFEHSYDFHYFIVWDLDSKLSKLYTDVDKVVGEIKKLQGDIEKLQNKLYTSEFG